MIKNKAEANEIGLRVVADEAALEKLDAEEKEAINRLKESNKTRREELTKRIDQAVDALGQYFWNTSDRDADTKGQLTLDGVRLQERVTTEFKYPSPIGVVVELAHKNGWDQFVRVKEEPNKEEVRASATPEQLRALRIRVSQTTSVYVKAR